MYFSADDGRHGHELWRSDGTPDGTTLVRDLQRGPIGYPYPEVVMAGDTLYVTISDELCGGDLWRTDGTRSGTVRLMATARPALQ